MVIGQLLSCRRSAVPAPQNPQVPLDIAHHFANVPDPRHRAFRDRHRLADILVIALSAVLSGARSWDAIADFGLTKEAWLRSIGLELPNGIPSHDTFNRPGFPPHPHRRQGGTRLGGA